MLLQEPIVFLTTLHFRLILNTFQGAQNYHGDSPKIFRK